ncbi:hypothetical protein PIB30_019409 [Stylosanthes scabra]|uniref:Uncharacterized protein n=1 Tax=Stylosanthes scabra TaxID=79078 RepID=A0ABU6Q8B7_9FABA|nr:hypothetical protein [Stylosanthes scabra]
MDSYKDPKESPARIEQLKDAANLLDKILEDRQFFVHSYTIRAKVSGYEFIEADTPQQDEGSNDGVSGSHRGLNTLTCGTITLRRTHMQIVLDLVMGKHNPKADEVCKLAISTWDRKVLNAKAKMNPWENKQKWLGRKKHKTSAGAGRRMEL